jgi:hypothetical protein
MLLVRVLYLKYRVWLASSEPLAQPKSSTVVMPVVEEETVEKKVSEKEE